VEIKGITKAFGVNNVLRGIDLDLYPGQVTVLMGANGAGKSTLVKIISGVHKQNAGTISLFGEDLDPDTPSQAIKAGVVTVHQGINDGVIPDLDIASNLMLDRLSEPSSGFFINRRRLREQAREVASAIGLDVDVSLLVSELDLADRADRQLVAIARAMAHRPKLLILDEPTSSLSATEVSRLFGLIDRLRENGVAILYISHRMSDIRRIADRIVSMRDGEISGVFADVFEGDALDYEGAVQAMLGHSMSDVDIEIGDTGETVVELKDISLSRTQIPFNLTLKTNEIVAFTGLVGSGKSELAAVLFGLARPQAGSIILHGKPYAPNSPRQAIETGVFLCPKDRTNNSVVQGFNISKNITIPFLERYSAASFLKWRNERKTTRRMIEEISIVCQSQSDDIGMLSGGNQQKVMIGRWLAQPSKLLVLDEPFQGVDIKSRRDIGTKIRQTADKRATIVFVAEMDEALEIADRIIVMADHTIVGEHINHKVDLNKILAQVAGKQTNPVQLAQ
jgi:simple sugar transport system ATP-binding protein